MRRAPKSAGSTSTPFSPAQWIMGIVAQPPARRDPRAALALEHWLAALVQAHPDRMLPVDAAITDEWGRLDAQGSLPVVDGLLAATARVHKLTLVTRNTRDVARTGIDVLDLLRRRPTSEGANASAKDIVPVGKPIAYRSLFRDDGQCLGSSAASDVHQPDHLAVGGFVFGLEEHDLSRI